MILHVIAWSRESSPIHWERGDERQRIGMNITHFSSFYEGENRMTERGEDQGTRMERNKRGWDQHSIDK